MLVATLARGALPLTGQVPSPARAQAELEAYFMRAGESPRVTLG